MAICPICEARMREFWMFHKCDPKRLARIDAAHRRATDNDLPDEPGDEEKAEEWAARMRVYDDGHHRSGRED